MLGYRNITMRSWALALIFSLLLVSVPRPVRAQDESLAGSFLSGENSKDSGFSDFKLIIITPFQAC